MEMLSKKEIGTAKVILSGVFFPGHPLSGNSHAGSAKNPGPDLALAEICYRLRFSHNRETVDSQVV
jgi:hypothetical protein